MKKTLLLAAAFAASLGMVTPADAAVFNWSYNVTNGAPLFAGGSFTTSDVLNSAGLYDILSITGSVSGDVITGLVTNPNQPNVTANSLFYYDNNYTGGNPFLTNAGVLFSTVSNSAYVWNLFSNAPDSYSLWFGDPNTGSYLGSSDGTMTLTRAVPEPSSWALMLFGFGIVGYVMRKRNIAYARQSFA